MSMTPSSPNCVNSLPAQGVYEIDLNAYRSETGTCDKFKVREETAVRAYEEPYEFAKEILPKHVATSGLGFIFGLRNDTGLGKNVRSYEIRGHLEARNSGRRYKLDSESSESVADNSRILDEVVMQVKLPSPLKKRVMGLLGRKALAKVAYTQNDGVDPLMFRKISNLSEDIELDSDLDFENDPEYEKLKAQNSILGSLRKDWNSKSKEFKIDSNLKDMDIVPVAPDKNWTKDVYAFLREDDRNNPMSLLRADWDESSDTFMNNQTQSALFNQLASEMDKEVVDKFVYGDDIFVQLANEMDQRVVMKFDHLRHNDKFMKDTSRPDDEPEEFSLV